MENSGRFVFYNNIYFFTKTKTKTTGTEPVLRDMLRHLHGL